MFGRKKMYKKGLADALQANEAFAKKQEEAIAFMREEVRNGNKRLEVALDDAISSLGGNISGLYAYLNSKEKAALYRLSTPMDLKELGDEEKRLLLAILYELSYEEGDTVTDSQRKYIRSIQRYLEIANPQTEADLTTVGEIDSLDVQKAFLQIVLEFFYLQDREELTDEQENFLSYFSVNRRQAEIIEERVSRLFNSMGPNGVAEKYGYVPTEETEGETNTILGTSLSDAEQLFFAGKLDNALPILEQIKDSTNGRAYYFLGMIYFWGSKNIYPNGERANSYWLSGYNEGDILCYNRVLLNGLLKIDNNERNQKWAEVSQELSEIAKAGDSFAEFELAIFYLNDSGTPHDYSKCVNLLESLANKGFFAAEYSLGLRYLYGQGAPKIINDANAWFERAYKDGSYPAGWKLLANRALTDGDRSEKTLALAGDLFNGKRRSYEIQFVIESLSNCPGFGYANNNRVYISLWDVRRTHDESFRSQSAAISIVDEDIDNAIRYANGLFYKGSAPLNDLVGKYKSFLNSYAGNMILISLGVLGEDTKVKALIDDYTQKSLSTIDRAIDQNLGQLSIQRCDLSINYDDWVFNFGDRSASGNSFFDRLRAEYSIMGSPSSCVDDLVNSKFQQFARTVRQAVIPVLQEYSQQFSRLVS